MKRTIALKVDVDTLKGYLEGVPAMLSLFKRHNVRVSFFFSFGPDNSGKAIRRIFRKGFIKKMMRTNAPGTYGLKTMMYGTILPAPLIVPGNPDIFRRTFDQGHECGIHAWDHVAWQDTLDSMPEKKMRDDFSRACEMFTNISGMEPRCCAAPAWKVTPASLTMQDEYGFAYCSDTRGTHPFMPIMEGTAFKTPQIPTTLPTMDEILGSEGIDQNNINDHYLEAVKPGLNVHTIHAEMEGGSMIHLLDELLSRCLESGISFLTIGEAMKGLTPATLPASTITNREISGRAGAVAVQSL
ncbi:MAG TPA: 4-deoxy-4-formamido-L-arabinose-phosphoundecaprenol deformylase [Synergistetes bacterium]|nr:4-deoxy-4-formamido-L-arabinose-phosphoundecaprenol deformylase [Synergistota bacterium]